MFFTPKKTVKILLTSDDGIFIA